ncbi:MAG: glycosyltransferase family 4 protein [Akkermansiaceae bacterium]|nr:glycosyltransferase family 4 protein [Akkermansiaceae bacterium]
MKFAIFLQHYFPYGGLQRDAVRLAQAAVHAGDLPTLVVATWQGDKPGGIPVVELNSGGSSNHSKAARFATACQRLVQSGDFDTSICFSRVPNTPFHFCGDSCFLDKFLASKPALARLLPRYRYFLNTEQQLFGPGARTHVFFLAEPDVKVYQEHYQLARERLTVLPPWVKKPTPPEQSRAQTRRRIFDQLGLAESDQLLLFVGSNFKLKRVATIIEALPLTDKHVHLAVCGDDKADQLTKLAVSRNVANRVHTLGPRNDIPSLMTAADLLVHPSSRETAGMVLVEALTHGLPVTCTRLCGYASHVADAGGTLLSDDCPPQEICDTVTQMLGDLPTLRQQALDWASSPALYRTANVILDHMRESVKQSPHLPISQPQA